MPKSDMKTGGAAMLRSHFGGRPNLAPFYNEDEIDAATVHDPRERGRPSHPGEKPAAPATPVKPSGFNPKDTSR
jgi:hypothetical protein